EFLERVEELSEIYGYAGEYVLRVLPEMLRGEALAWYRVSRHTWATWENLRRDFRAEYLPRKMLAQLCHEARSRVQRDGEPFRAFSNEVLTLLRRAGGWSPEEQLELLYENMHLEYKRGIRIDDIVSIGDLRARAAEHEDIE
ncbi:hypothetical protein EAI_05402, partial [Harpegnathos saltator]